MLKHSAIDRIVFFGICFLLVFAPLAFGSVHVWAYSVVMIGVFSLFALLMLDRLVRKKGGIEWIKTPMDWPFLLIFILIAIQVLPLPLPVLKLFSPLAAQDKERLFSILRESGQNVPQWAALAYYRHPVIIEGLKLAAYVGMFYLVLHTVNSKRRMNTLIYVLIAVGIFEALYGVSQVLSREPRVWWWKSRVGALRFASGTFVGSNHFAGYMEILIPLTFGFMLAQQRRIRRMLSGLGGARAAVQRIVSWFAPESARPRMVFLFFAGIIMAAALLMSASRSGILSLGFSMLGVSALFFSRRRYRKYGTVCLLFCAAALIYGSQVGIDTTLQKFKDTEAGFSRRLITFKSMLPMLQDYPILGVGWGNFRYLYPRYMPQDYDGVSSSGYSHNDWLEAATETGFLGGGLILLAFIVYLYKTVRIWSDRRDPYALGIGAGTTAAFLSLGFHSVSDFNMHIPANPLTLAAVLGLGYAAIHCRSHGMEDSFFYRTIGIERRKWKSAVLFAAGMVVIGLGLFGTLRHFIAENSCPTEWNSTMNLNWKPFLAEIRKAIDLNPGNAEYHWLAAQYYIGANPRDQVLQKKHNEAAISHLEKGACLNAARGIYWSDLGKRYSLRSYDPYDYLTKWLPIAEGCFDMAVKCAPLDAVILFDTAWYWVWRSSILSFREGITARSGGSFIQFKEDGIEKFQAVFRRSLNLAPNRWKKAVDRVMEYYPDDAIVLGIVPDTDERLKNEILRYLVKNQRERG